ncbi:MAG: hypothetical protein O7E57_06990, partial [Gammaproteobacteria bacterium]|nr:hypothetical protein [Gammaproteobacteria bacterium]
YQYTFEPIRILKGVYSRPRLLMTNADLRSYSTSFDPKDIQSGQQRLLLLGRSSVGYIGIHSGATADLAFPRLEGKTDPLLGAAEALLAQQELLDRFEIVSRLARHLRDAEGRGAMVLLAALDRRPYIAAQQDLAIKAINQQLTADEVLVREAAAHVMGNLLRADYLNNHVNREAAVAGLVASLNHPDTSLAARVAALQGLGSAVDAVRSNPAAVRLVGLDTPYETLAELSARLDILGALHENSGIDPSAAVSGLLTNLPLDAPAHVQLAATKSWARLATANGADRLLDRLRRKKALGLEGAAEVEAFGLILPKTSTPWQLQSTLLEIGLTTSEQEAFVQACEHTPSPQLVSALSDMLDPRHRRLSRLAANLLMEIDTKAAARALRAHMPEEADLAYKLHLAAFLGTHGFDDGYPFALEHMSDPRYLEAAVEALATINSSGTSDELLEIYGTSNDLGWKRAAVRTLGLLGHKAFQDELLNLTRDLDHPLAPSALQARADMGDVAVIGLLPTALSSHNQGIAVAGARAAARVLSQQRGGGNPAATDVRKALGTLARDPGAVQAVRHLALEALVTADDPQLHDVLIVMVRDFQLERSTLMTRVRELLRDRKVRM